MPKVTLTVKLDVTHAGEGRRMRGNGLREELVRAITEALEGSSIELDNPEGEVTVYEISTADVTAQS